jgi:hypothetical protein
MALYFIPKAPKISRNLVDLLPETSGSAHHKCVLVYKTLEDYVSESLNATYENMVTSGGFNCGRGLSYVSKHTRGGFCGSALVTDRRDGCIAGFHVSGNSYSDDSRLGFAQEVLYSDYMDAKNILNQQVSFSHVPEMREPDKVRLGHTLVQGKGPHPKTEMFEKDRMEPYNCMEVKGHTLDLPKYRSKVRKSLISDSVEEIFGVPCTWKAPDMKQPWIHHNKALEHVAKGAWEVDPDALEWAYKDYWEDIMTVLPQYIKKHPEYCRVLTDLESINGIAGSMYMEPAKMTTSAGIPLTSKLLSGLFVELDPLDDGRKRYDYTPWARDHYDKMIEILKSGKMYNVWSRSCLKDEVVEEDSDKVRIFYILECLFAMLVRKYYLPVIEFISRHPLTCECAVGINCASPEWQEMKNFVESISSDGTGIDWDYSKYDLKRPQDVMIASLRILRNIAKEMGYSSDDLTMM